MHSKLRYSATVQTVVLTLTVCAVLAKVFSELESIMAAQQKMTGGIGEVKEATEEVQSLLDQVKSDVEEAGGKTFETFTAVSFKTQVVAGVNYFVKVKVGEGKYIHVRIYKHFSGTVSFSSFQDDKTEEDPIEYF